MVLFKSLVEIAADPMSHLVAELDSYRSGISAMAVCGDRIGRDAGHRIGRSKKRLGRFNSECHDTYLNRDEGTGGSRGLLPELDSVGKVMSAHFTERGFVFGNSGPSG
jgi:hypothetical protein